MMQKKAILLAKMDPPAVKVEDFNDWYNNKHVAARLTIPGILSGRRFSKIEGIPRQHFVPSDAQYLALYDLTSKKVLDDKPYQTLRNKEAALAPDSYEFVISKLPNFTRAIYEQIYSDDKEYIMHNNSYIFVVGHDVPRNRHREFNVWYNTEHIPALLSVPGFIEVRRFRLAQKPIVSRGGSVSEYLTIWDIRSRNALLSDEFIKASNSPWSDWVRSWYSRRICSLYERIFP